MNYLQQIRSILVEPHSINLRDDDSELRAALKIILLDMDNATEVDQTAFDSVVEFIKHGYGYLDPRELPPVFDLALLGKLHMEIKLKPMFSKRYIGSVLSHYDPERRRLAKDTREKFYQGYSFPKPKETLKLN